MSLLDEILSEIERHLDKTGMSATAFGSACSNDGHLVHRMRRGESITLRSVERIRHFIATGESLVVPGASSDDGNSDPPIEAMAVHV